MLMDMENLWALAKLQAMPSKRQIRMEESWHQSQSYIWGERKSGFELYHRDHSEDAGSTD